MSVLKSTLRLQLISFEVAQALGRRERWKEDMRKETQMWKRLLSRHGENTEKREILKEDHTTREITSLSLITSSHNSYVSPE